MNVDNIRRILRALEKRECLEKPQLMFSVYKHTGHTDHRFSDRSMKTLIVMLMEEVSWPLKRKFGIQSMKPLDPDEVAAYREVREADYVSEVEEVKELIALAQELVAPFEDESKK